jgi:hypothetical protein
VSSNLQSSTIYSNEYNEFKYLAKKKWHYITI